MISEAILELPRLITKWSNYTKEELSELFHRAISQNLINRKNEPIEKFVRIDSLIKSGRKFLRYEMLEYIIAAYINECARCNRDSYPQDFGGYD